MRYVRGPVGLYLFLRGYSGRSHHRGTTLPWPLGLFNNDHLIVFRIARMTQAVLVIVSG